MAAVSGGQATLANSTVTTYGDTDAAALYVQDGGAISVSGSTVQALGAEGQAISSKAGAGQTNQVNVSGSRLMANGTAIEVNDAGHTEIQISGSEILTNSGTLYANADGLGTSSLDASASRLQGDMRISDGHVADVSLSNGSLWEGAGSGVNQVTLSASQWTMTGSSTIASLDNSGVVSFAPGGFKSLEVSGDLTGNGLFEMNTNLAASQGDMVTVGGNATGSHQVLVRDTNTGGTAPGQHLEIIRTEGGDAQFSLANRGQVVDSGAYRYNLQTSDTVGGRGSDWSLVNTGKLSTAASAAVNTGGAGTAQSIWYAEMSTLTQRMGELRSGHDAGGPWVRGFGQQQSIDNGGGREFSQHIGGMEFGADTRVNVSSGRWHLGALAGYSRANRDFADEGKGNTDSYHVGAYATFIADSGWYLDAVAKVNRMRHDIKVESTDGSAVKADYHNNSLGLSLEGGRRIPLDNDWFVEPQVQAAWFGVGQANYRMSNDLHVQADSGNSVLLRASSLIGKRFSLANGAEIQPYVKIGWIQELDGKNVVRTNEVATHTDMSGGRAQIGIGAIGALGKSHHRYADYEYQKGSGYESPWAVNIGYRYTW
ncbi:autotransporter outer membrane beta-barrel domain-containing protein [Achromobacter xylosoxidans]|uniref:autotransporter outer membrane beta-barrel domain-containing protein n=2 Tax=Alcaligenes xylosoxydans xylosoxydans TaxID=85698 RepID=UPI0015CD07EA|nr:autotransporter outer membrane beta-barrel domain-containing protein [Achromobacter xylosoxidans]NYS11435.1 autotransporter outer membrane beta-barrel domain-containing protein [Achromobacter xylosoxidans]